MTDAIDELTSSSELARKAACDRATSLCDRIDRVRLELETMRAELEGATAVCHALLDASWDSAQLRALARAERILDELSRR